MVLARCLSLIGEGACSTHTEANMTEKGRSTNDKGSGLGVSKFYSEC